MQHKGDARPVLHVKLTANHNHNYKINIKLFSCSEKPAALLTDPMAPDFISTSSRFSTPPPHYKPFLLLAQARNKGWRGAAQHSQLVLLDIIVQVREHPDARAEPVRPTPLLGTL